MSRTKKRRCITLRTHDRPKPARRPDPVPVIVELHGDGFLKIYGPRHVRPFILNRFDDDGPAEIRADLANQSDQFHELELPRLHRSYYWPKHVLATGLIEKRTPEGDRRRQETLGVIRGLRDIHADLLERQKARAAS